MFNSILLMYGQSEFLRECSSLKTIDCSDVVALVYKLLKCQPPGHTRTSKLLLANIIWK